MSRISVVLALAAASLVRGAVLTHSGPRGADGVDQQRSLLQTWDGALQGDGAKDTPVTRVVNLLKSMQATLNKEAEEDEALYDKLACWCNNNEYEKGNQIEAATAKISELEATIEQLTAKSGELKVSIKELEDEVAADKKALDEATAMREKEQKKFHGEELDSIQAIENMKAALDVLMRHNGAPAALQSAFQQISMIQSSKDGPWASDHEENRLGATLDDFMRHAGFATSDDSVSAPVAPVVASPKPRDKFLQQQDDSAADATAAGVASSSSASTAWTSEDTFLVKRALKSASAFMQTHHISEYFPAYHSQSGEIVGVVKELKEEMESDLSESQKSEMASAAAFAELRSAKTSEIENGEKMAETKEDELASTDNALAEAKEDLGQFKASLDEFTRFLASLKMTCEEATKNFGERKVTRLSEIKAVSETIEILTQDEARDAMSSTYSFVQLRESKDAGKRKQAAAKALRAAAAKANDPTLSVLATQVELDAFTKVKKAIDDMIATLKVQQDDEVKRTDWCKAEIQANEMDTAKTTDKKTDLEAAAGVLASSISALEQGIKDAASEIAQLQLDLQRASEDRQVANKDFQKTVADQTVTVAVLKKALDKLATYYDKAGLLQQKRTSQTPPVPQMEYKPSQGAAGVMQMIEKLIYEAKELIAESKKGESDAQVAYENTIKETNSAVAALQKEVVFKTKTKAKAIKDKIRTEADIADSNSELDGLSKYNADLHSECDYVLKNFEVRQQSRAEEIEALQQAKQILSGASLS